MLEVTTKRGTLSLALVGTGVASVTTCSIEGGVLNMGYVIAGESTSAGFKVKCAAGTGACPTSWEGSCPRRGSALPWSGSRRGCRPLPPHPQQQSPPQPSVAGEAVDARPPPPPPRCPGLLPRGFCVGCPTWDRGELSSGTAQGRGRVGSPARAGKHACLLLLPQGLRDVATLGWSQPQDTCFLARFSPGPDSTAQARDSRECFMGAWGALSGRG